MAIEQIINTEKSSGFHFNTNSITTDMTISEH